MQKLYVLRLMKEGVPKVIGVQFHPEAFTANGYDTFLSIFKYLVEQARK